MFDFFLVRCHWEYSYVNIASILNSEPTYQPKRWLENI